MLIIRILPDMLMRTKGLLVMLYLLFHLLLKIFTNIWIGFKCLKCSRYPDWSYIRLCRCKKLLEDLLPEDRRLEKKERNIMLVKVLLKIWLGNLLEINWYQIFYLIFWGIITLLKMFRYIQAKIRHCIRSEVL